jgi:hypothetical protein
MGYLKADVCTTGFKWLPPKKDAALAVWSVSVKIKTAGGAVSTFITSASDKYEYPLDSMILHHPVWQCFLKRLKPLEVWTPKTPLTKFCKWLFKC